MTEEKPKKQLFHRTKKNGENLKLQQKKYMKKYGERLPLEAIAGKLLETASF